MEQNHIWIYVTILPVMVCTLFKPAQVLTGLLEVVHGRSDQQMNPTLGDQLGIMALPIMEFQVQGYKIRKILNKKEIIEF